MLKDQNKISRYAAIVVGLYILIYHFSLPFYQKHFFSHELTWDILSYYLYLPLTFIYHDPGMTRPEIIEYIFKTYEPSATFYQAFQLPNGNYVLNYMSGFAILYLPFFFIGHLWAHLGGYAPDGFSFPYQFSISCGVYIYIIAGIFAFRKLLLRFFPDSITTLTLLFMLLGTNYFNEAARANLMPHAIMFAVFAFLINAVIDWYKSPGIKTGIKTGALLAIAVLCRPSEILIVIFILLYGIKNWEDVKSRIQFYLTNFKSVLAVLGAIFVLCIPQFIYWNKIAGSFIFFSYQNTEGFDFTEPHLWECLFSFKNSWFVYTPLIIFPLLGMLILRKRLPGYFLPILTFVLINFFVLSSWLAWWNGGGFGMRYYVESYVLLALPMACLIEWLSTRAFLAKSAVYTVMVVLLVWNQFQTWQFSRDIMPHDRRNKKFFKAAMFDTSINPEHHKLLDVERNYGYTDEFRNESDYVAKTIGFFNFSDVNSTPIDKSLTDTIVSYSAPAAFKMDSAHIFSPGIEIPFEQVTNQDHAWVRATLKFYPVVPLETNPASIVITMKYQGRNFYYKGFDLEKVPYQLNQWNTISVVYLTPYPFSVRKERLSAYVWLRGNQTLYIDDFHIEALEKKQY